MDRDEIKTFEEKHKESIEKRHQEIMSQLQIEWEDHAQYHKQFRGSMRGIRSSQISALVALLIKKGVLK